MAGADTITALDSSAFETIKQNARNSKARKLIHQDALQDSHIIAERQRDRGNFLKNSKSLAGDAFDMMEDTYSTSSNRHAVNEEVGQAGIQYDQMLEQRMAKLQQGMNQQQMSGGLGLVNQNRLVQEEAPRASKFLPKEINDYYEPFAGGLGLMYRLLDNGLINGDIFANDISAELISFYRNVNNDNLINELWKISNCCDYVRLLGEILLVLSFALLVSVFALLLLLTATASLLLLVIALATLSIVLALFQIGFIW